MGSTDEVHRRVYQGTGLRFFSLLSLVMFLVVATPSWAKPLTIGTISAVPVDEVRVFQPFADFLAELLADDGIDEGKVVIAETVNQMAALLKSGEVDLFIDSSVTALVVNKLSGSQFMLRRWKKDRGQYRSVIFVSDDSPIKALDDLKDKLIAFEEPFSTSGYMLPALAIRRQGLKLNEVTSVQSVPPFETIGYIMAYDNETQAAWLERGRVQAAGMSEDDFQGVSNTALKPFRALHVTPFVPYHVVSHRPMLDVRLVERIKAVLKSAHETEPGREILARFERTTKFDDIPPSLLDNVLQFEPFLQKLIAQR